MVDLQDPYRAVRFGPFEYNPATGELDDGRHKTRLVGQPVELLNLMLERPGKLITREEMRSRLWPQDTFVDFEHSLNSAIKKLRRALGDSAANPQFIETLARQGYRFIASIEPVQGDETGPADSTDPKPAQESIIPEPRRSRSSHWAPSLRILGAAVAIVGIAVAFVILRERLYRLPEGASKVTLLLAGEGDLSEPAISSDGKMLAYVKAEQGTSHIYIRRLAGGPALRLCHEDAREAEPVFSPDDERVAFTRYLPHSSRAQLCVAPVLGGKAVRAVEGGRDPAWSPDGTQLAFVLESAAGHQALATSARDGTALRILARADAVYPFFHYPSWSMDSRSIAFERGIGANQGEICTVPVGGGPARRLEREPPRVYLHHPVFTPDGKGLVYSSNRAGGRNLWLHSFGQGNTDTQLTRGPGPEEWPSISRTGSLVFLKVESRDMLLSASLAGGAPSRLFSHSPYLWAPAVSPQGHEIAVSVGEYNGSWRIWTLSIHGADLGPLTSGREPQIYGRFSHHGEWLIYTAWTPGASRIWRVALRDGPPQPLTPANEDAAFGDVSPDGRMLAFARSQQGAAHVDITPVAGGAERQLTPSPSTVPRWSPDGEWIAFSPNRSLEGGVFIIHPDGSGAKQLTSSGGWPVWLPDGKRLAFRVHRPDGSQQIDVVTTATGQVTRLGNIRFSGDNEPFDLSLDGKSIVYTNGITFSSEIWLLNTRR